MNTITKNRIVEKHKQARQRNQRAKVLRQFSEIEADSSWQYLNALDFTNDNELKRVLFKNVLEERNHAEIFDALAHNIAISRTPLLTRRRKLMIKNQSELNKFLAYVHCSEKNVHDKFLKYSQTCPDTNISNAFKLISDDEKDHESEILFHLQKLTGCPKKSNKIVILAKLKQSYEAWMRFSEKFGTIIFTFLLSVIFYCFGIFTYRPKKNIEP